MDAALLGPTVNVVSTQEEVRQFVRGVKAAGVDFVKTYSSLSREAYFSIAEEAKKQGIPFAGHVPFAVDAAEASSAGQRSMEHLNQILESSSSRSQELLRVPGRDWSSKYDKLTLDTFDEGNLKTSLQLCRKTKVGRYQPLCGIEWAPFAERQSLWKTDASGTSRRMN